MKIGILGNGNVGTRLSALFTQAGHSVVVGTRDGSFGAAAEHGEVVILAVPFKALDEVVVGLASTLVGKVVVDATNPLNEDWSPHIPEGAPSGAEWVQQRLPEARVVKAFNTIFADSMRRRAADSGQPGTTGFLCGDDAAARASVHTLLSDAGFLPVDAGPLLAARYLEAMAHLNIQLAVGMKGGTEAVFHYHRPTDFVAAS